MTMPPLEYAQEMIARRDRRALVELVRSTALESGYQAVLDLMTAIQIDVGNRWQQGRWSVAEEHAATAIVDDALAALDSELFELPSHGGVVTVACPEREWHVLPARLISHSLMQNGWDVSFLGAALPDDQLAPYLQANKSIALVLSCSLSANLPGALRSVQSAHEAQTPVLVGGSSFATAPHLASAIGADAYAQNGAEADEILRGWEHATPTLAKAQVDSEGYEAVAAARSTAIPAVLHIWSERYPPAATWSSLQYEKFQGDLETLSRHIETAVLTRCPEVLTQHLQWRAVTHQARGEPPGLVRLWLQLLHEHFSASARDATRDIISPSDLVNT